MDGWESNSIPLCSSTTSESDLVVRGRRINDKAFDPTNGALQCHCDTDFHFPILKQSTNAPCSLCHWAMKEEASQDKCRIHVVHVQLSCFPVPFLYQTFSNYFRCKKVLL
jgi:uncharacterized paraquat-inducible protein A